MKFPIAYEAAKAEMLREIREGRATLVPVAHIPAFVKRLGKSCRKCNRPLQPDGLGTRGCSPSVNRTCDRETRTAILVK